MELVLLSLVISISPLHGHGEFHFALLGGEELSFSLYFIIKELGELLVATFT